MFKTIHLDFRNAGVLSPLVRDYLEKKKELASFYSYFPDKAGFDKLLKSAPYKDFDREQLSSILMQQSQLVGNSSEETIATIKKLAHKNTFTVTTGHQLCLFTGPLYFIYKIISTIRLAEELKKEFPAYEFVPVYWMASEDHDFEEISSFHVQGKTITWKSEQAGAVGDFKTAELNALLPELKEALGISANSKYLYELFEKAYLKHDNLADATRYLVNALFGHYGLVTLDGNDKAFKQQFKHILRQDIFDSGPQHTAAASIQQLEALGYSAQVNPRPINCFYIERGLRARLEKQGDVFNLVGTPRSFTRSELEHIIETAPEKISPNVVLRPVYQQVILPNIAYLGGPGELAYWLEFKAMFDELNVFFPVLMPRNFISVIDKATANKIDKSGFEVAEFFKPEQDIIKDMLVKTNAVFKLDAEAAQLASYYNAITQRAAAVDTTLERHVAAALKRSLNQLDVISAKTNRALKRKAETEINRIHGIKEYMFPKDTPQERYENFAALYLAYGSEFFKAIEAAIEPFVLDQKILVEA